MPRSEHNEPTPEEIEADYAKWEEYDRALLKELFTPKKENKSENVLDSQHHLE